MLPALDARVIGCVFSFLLADTTCHKMVANPISGQDGSVLVNLTLVGAFNHFPFATRNSAGEPSALYQRFVDGPEFAPSSAVLGRLRDWSEQRDESRMLQLSSARVAARRRTCE